MVCPGSTGKGREGVKGLRDGGNEGLLDRGAPKPPAAQRAGGICRILVPRALNDTKMIRKAGADIFVKFGAEQP